MKKLCGILSTLLLIVLLIVALAFTLPMVMGYKELAVLSGSMEPEIPVGSIVCVDDDADPGQMQVGDVVTYSLDADTFVTHRVVSIDQAGQTFVTKGDANDVEDGEISFSQFYGIVKFHIPYMGFISANIRTPAGILTVTGVIVVIILLNTLPALLSKEKEPEKGPAEEKIKKD